MNFDFDYGDNYECKHCHVDMLEMIVPDTKRLYFFCPSCQETYSLKRNKIKDPYDDGGIRLEYYINPPYEEVWEVDEDDAPAGCAACGGDWPYCRSGCNLYDD